MKKYNCLILNNEIWTLELRIKYDLEIFDYIILAESNKTFSGISKPFYYEKYKHLFKEYEDKIIYCKIYNLPEPIQGNFLGVDMKPVEFNRWPAEHYMRHQFKKFIVENTDDDDFIYFQDLDEIQNNERFKRHIYEGHEEEIVYNAMNNYKFTLTSLDCPTQPPWYKSFVATTKIIKQIDVHDYRKIHPFRSTHRNIKDYAKLNESKPTYYAHHIADNLRHNDLFMDGVYSKYVVPVQNIIFKDDFRGIHLSAMTYHIDSKMKIDCFSHNEIKTGHDNLYSASDLEKITDDIIEKYYDTKMTITPHDWLIKRFPFILKTKFGGMYQ